MIAGAYSATPGRRYPPAVNKPMPFPMRRWIVRRGVRVERGVPTFVDQSVSPHPPSAPGRVFFSFFALTGMKEIGQLTIVRYYGGCDVAPEWN